MKTWIKTNLSKITLALALTGLIIGSLAHNKTNNLTYFLNHDHIAVWGNTTIWKHEFEGGY